MWGCEDGGWDVREDGRGVYGIFSKAVDTGLVTLSPGFVTAVRYSVLMHP